MGVVREYCSVITVAAGSTTITNIATVPLGKVLKLKKLYLHFPAGTNYELQVYVMKGPIVASPDTGYYTGDDSQISVQKPIEYHSGSTFSIKATNTNTTTSKSFFVYALLEEEEWE